MNKESLKVKTSEGLGNFLLENVHRDLNGTRNLEKARIHLENGSILFYFNHFAKLDPILYGGIIRDYLTPLEKVAGITSLRHIDPNRGKFNALQGQLIEGWQKAFGLRAIPVIQAKDKKDYPDADSFNRSAVKTAVRFLRDPGHVLSLSPEGTRSTINELLEAEEGFETIFKLGGPNVLALPVAGVHSTIRPYNTKTKVYVGKPFSYKEVQKESKDLGESVTELAMRRLAILLPEQNRGYYL